MVAGWVGHVVSVATARAAVAAGAGPAAGAAHGAELGVSAPGAPAAGVQAPGTAALRPHVHRPRGGGLGPGHPRLCAGAAAPPLMLGPMRPVHWSVPCVSARYQLGFAGGRDLWRIFEIKPRDLLWRCLSCCIAQTVGRPQNLRPQNHRVNVLRMAPSCLMRNVQHLHALVHAAGRNPRTVSGSHGVRAGACAGPAGQQGRRDTGGDVHLASPGGARLRGGRAGRPGVAAGAPRGRDGRRCSGCCGGRPLRVAGRRMDRRCCSAPGASCAFGAACAFVKLWTDLTSVVCRDRGVRGK